VSSEPGAGHEQVSLGEASPREALVAIRGLYDQGLQGFGPRLYVTLKALTLKLLTARRRTELAEWIDVIRQASALAKSRGEEGFGERLLALSDLTTDWMRTSEAHPIKEVLERPHVRRILRTIRDLGGSAKRAHVLRLTRLGEANLSRILGSLETVGLIERDNRRERTITLTAEAENYLLAAVAQPSGHIAELTPQESALIAAGVAKAKAAAATALGIGERLKTAVSGKLKARGSSSVTASEDQADARSRTHIRSRST
jgi:hypothetical protein